MPKKLGKSLKDYLINKIKKPTSTPPLIHSNSTNDYSFSSSKNWIISSCKHPSKTLSFAIGRDQLEKVEKNNTSDNKAARLSDVDRFLFENFKSLYINDDGDHDYYHEKKDRESHEAGKNPSGVLFGSPCSMDPPPDLSGTQLFFINPAGFSSMTVTSDDAGSTPTSTTSTVNNSSTTSANDDHAKDVKLPNDSVAVLAYSLSPSEDFQLSMQEMVDAFVHNNGKVDWNFMEELLFSYLNLNEKKSYRYILNAFVDLIVKLRQNSNGFSARPLNSARTVRFTERERLITMRTKTISESKVT